MGVASDTASVGRLGRCRNGGEETSEDDARETGHVCVESAVITGEHVSRRAGEIRSEQRPYVSTGRSAVLPFGTAMDVLLPW